MIGINKFIKTIFIIIIIGILGMCGYKVFMEVYNYKMDKKYETEISKMSKKDLSTVNKVISLAKERIGNQYTWGGKGEIVTEERLKELISYYGESYYPLSKEEYIGKQGFDCSGLTYWTYKTVTGVNIGYSTTEQKEVLKDYKVNIKEIQPGDLIFTTRHVVMYMGKGKVIHSAGRMAYPMGGIKTSKLIFFEKGQVYRPIDYINKINK